MDREMGKVLMRVIKAWECCNPFNRKCKECPYEKDCYHDGISRHMVADAIALLKEQEEQIDEIADEYLDLGSEMAKQPQIVRCKDCKHRSNYFSCDMYPCFAALANDEWFCADGERRK